MRATTKLRRWAAPLAVGGAAVIFVGTAVTALACTDAVTTQVKDASSGANWAGTEATGAVAYDVATVSWSSDDNDQFGAPAGTVTFTFYKDGTCSPGEDNVNRAWFQSDVAITDQGESDGTYTATATSKDTAGLAEGNYSFYAFFDSSNIYPDGYGSCEPLSVTAYDPPTATTVHDATTTDTWSGSEITGATAFDTTTVTTPDGAPTATGTVTYTFYNDGTCGTDNVVWTEDPVTLVDGAAPNSGTTAALSAGSYSFSATYSGDSNYAQQTGACEPFTVSTAPTPAPSATPTGSVQGITTPSTGAGPTSGLNLLGLALLAIGVGGLVAQYAIRRRIHRGKVTIDNI